MRYYSKSTGCTYLEGIHKEMPADAVLITESRFAEVLGTSSPGKVRSHDSEGLPIWINPPEPTVEVLAAEERVWRDLEFERVKWLRERHRDQVEINQRPTLAPEQFSELLFFLRSLRDWPQSPDFPSKDSRPVVPAWIAEQPE
ncbi:phage tail protein [Pseudomonas sp. MWU16-30322]|uniref:phage tail protein n=1 Tax=Pseudomonas sp. MWU16-30322 TaxID=2878092 RepID=UPI001CFBCACE|nr:phage tail protein [Pseudomonas sp. MWU16-30322]